MNALPRRLALLSALLLISSCGGGDGGDTMTPPTVASVTITPATASLTAFGQTIQLSAAAKDNSGSAVAGTSFTWTSSDEGVATVSATGLVTAVGNGTAQISATADGKAGSAQITVAQEASSVTLDPATLQVEVGGTGQITAAVADAQGNAVGGATVAWSSSDESVATVDNTGLVTGVAAGSAVVTATAGSASGTTDVTVTAPAPFAPSQDTTLSGTMTVAEVTIPAGVTVTLTADADITANGPVSIAGSLKGDCTSATINGKVDVAVSGSVTTTCSASSPEDSLPVLTIMAAGALTLNNATITSGGDVVIGNPSGAAATASAFGGPAAAAGQAGCQVSGNSSVKGGDGASSETPGKNGQRGGNVDITCAGNPNLGGLHVEAGVGGAGASQEVVGGTATAVGAAGGRGGSVSINAAGDHIDAGVTMTLIVGDGGIGGNGSAKSQDPAVKAMATGGSGGDAGTLTVNVPFTGGSTVNVAMGFGGLGGFGRADAANGTEAHFDGGDAEGHGGKGGDAPAVTPAAFSSSQAIFSTTPPKGGFGGFGAGEFGSGKDGTADHRDGGDAGGLTAFGGAGGSVMDEGGQPGDGGEMDVVLQHGGNAFNGCPTLTAGGNGGKGGSVAGSPGLGGFYADGATNGRPGDLIFGQVGIGGDGGDGVGPGTGGTAGTNGALELGNVIGKAGSFKPGKDGTLCAPAADVAISLTSDPNGHEPYIGYTSISGITLRPHEDGSLSLTSSDSRWVTLDGTLSGDDFTASGTGTVAGYSGIPVSITGTLTRDGDGNVTGFTGTITIDGTNLPADSNGNHNNVTYDISGTVP